MISKEAYESLVNGYADEILEKSAGAADVFKAAKGRAGKLVEKAKNTAKRPVEAYKGSVAKRTDAAFADVQNKNNTAFENLRGSYYVDPAEVAYYEAEAAKNAPGVRAAIKKRIMRNDALKAGGGVLGTGAVVVGGNKLLRSGDAKEAAEHLIEAVMVKQAAYNQMEDASVCFDAGNAALDYIGYELR